MSAGSQDASLSSLKASTLPTIIGDYVLHKKLGQGSYGIVKLANNMFKNETLACKVICKDGLSEKSAKNLYKEVEFLRKIDHPNVIRIISQVEEPSHLYIFIEYAGGGSLRDMIRSRTALKEKEACVFFRQIVEGVIAIHARNIVHRDLKSSNILLSADLDVKIADFGLADYWSPDTKLTQSCGTLSYSSPEIILKQPYIGPEIDVWSLGVILFEMVAGYRPFEDEDFDLSKGSIAVASQARIQENITTPLYKIPATFSPALADLIRAIFQVDSSKRITLTAIKDHVWVADTSVPKQLILSRSEPVEILENRYPNLARKKGIGRLLFPRLFPRKAQTLQKS